ncbi:acetyltransferase family protein [Collimonas arenae]|uniref:Acetyltransferase family protein n=1 Tax=Collimonas arenae TaxID=279058 RepID=A0A127PTP1_9BURK|nr:GNAT family N-acetyltransferase [Collimonas arenae]AMP00742.1 acetyltransferase family protein [Collimonas arenae]AMP10633.1 acetyltransferase family protein [Collimonas arenae]
MAPNALAFTPATEEDLSFLLALRDATMTPHLIRAGAAIDEASQLARIRYRFEHAQIVSLKGRKIGLLKACKEEAQWYIVQIQIMPECQGQGLGRQIVEHILAQASRDRLPTALKVLEGNPARRLYEKLGFKEARQEGIEYLMVCPPRLAIV